MIVGASDGRFGLYVDGNLDRGRVDACDTYADWPPEDEEGAEFGPRDFRVKCLEAFSFG